MDTHNARGDTVIVKGMKNLAVIVLIGVATACGSSSDGGTKAPTVSRVTIAGSATPLNVGQSTQLTATATDASGTTLTNVGSTIWTSVVPSIAAVDQTGKVTAVSAGSGSVSADIAGVKGTFNVKVVAQSSSKDTIFTIGIASFSPNTITIAKGASVVFSLGMDGTGHDVRFAAAAGAPADIPVVVRQNVPRTFDVAGTFNYICPTHPQMTGTITVQ
ncbi:MAG: Ig-like domain-containing protein [bacterium]